MAKQIKCTFTSVWDSGSEITTPCLYDSETGEVTPDTCNANPEGSLVREFITLPGGDEKEVCTDCHEYVKVVAMNEGVGKQLAEVLVCPNCKE